MTDETSGGNVTYGDLMALIQHVDIPMDAQVVVEVGPELANTDVEDVPDEVPVLEVAAMVGYGRPSKIIFRVE